MKSFAVILSVLCVSIASARNVAEISDRLVNGTTATIEEFPYQVGVLARMVSGQIMRLCGGSIIGKQWVLTAAHCKNSLPDSRIVIRAGSSKLFSGGTVHSVNKSIVHPKYKPYDHVDYDIAVLKVNEEFTFNVTTQPVKLVPKGKVIKSGVYVNMTGWGYTEKFEFPDDLRQLSLPISSQRKCEAVYNNGESCVTNNTLCAGNVGGGSDFCYGDEGGPLVYEGMQIGVAAFTKSCATGAYPGVYTSVSVFRDWIKEQTGI